MAVEVRLARDARMHFELYPETEVQVSLRGRLLGAFGRSKRVKFYLVQDVTEKIQILVDRVTCGEEIADSFASISLGDGIQVDGTVGVSNAGKLCVFPVSPASPIPALNVANLIADETSNVAAQVLLARLENRCRTFFADLDFTELAARHLSSTWSQGGLQPLEVIFPGQSIVPFFLTVSPLPQLLRALITTGQLKFFTVARSFATNFVATQNGAESIMAGAVALDTTTEQAVEIAIELVRAMISDYQTSVDEDLRAELSGTILVSESNLLRENSVYPRLHAHITRGPLGLQSPGNFPLSDAYRLCWRGEFDVAEGYTFMLGERTCATIIVNIERFLPLLRTRDNRRLGDIGNPLGTSHE